jgi:hypothetical protein
MQALPGSAVADRARHQPIVITINPSEAHTDSPIMPTQPDFDQATLAAVDAAAVAAFGVHGLLAMPACAMRRLMAAGRACTPCVASALVLDTGDAVLEQYRRGHPGLRGRVMFGFYPKAALQATFLNLQNSVRDEATIRSAVADGFIVRTRADADTRDARRHDYTRLASALQSVAQVISTDYYAGAKGPLKLDFS